MEINEKELTENELENVYGGAPFDFVKEEAIKNDNTFRKERIEELKSEKEKLINKEDIADEYESKLK